MSPRPFSLSLATTISILIGLHPSAACAQWQQAMPASTAYPETSASYGEPSNYTPSVPVPSPYPSTSGGSSPYAYPTGAASPPAAANPSPPSPYDNATTNGVAQPIGGSTISAPMGSVPMGEQPPITPGGNPLQAPTGYGAMSRGDYVDQAMGGNEVWSFHMLPTGLLYKLDLASPYETRMASRWTSSKNVGKVWDATLGARIGVLRYGTDNEIWPQGWQFDLGGAAFPRLDQAGDVVGNDYTFIAPLTMRQGRWEWELGYRHYCSHIADEYLLKNPGFHRINYVRDSAYTGLAFYVTADLRLYAEAGWGFSCQDGAKPWEFQFGIDFSPAAPTTVWGGPFVALNTHLTQENDFGGSFTAQAGWQWRGQTGHLLRIGAHYVNGMSEQRQFYNQWEQQVGGGIWYDF